MNFNYRCRQCKQQWPKDKMGDGLYGRLKYCPQCNSLCDPITEPKEVQPPDGYSWHRDDWTRDMLPDGWRPLLLNEPCETGDQVLVEGQWREGIDTGACMTPRHLHTRTWRPLPGASATGAQAETPLESALAWADEIVQLESVALGRAKRNIQALASAARDLTASREECECMREEIARLRLSKHKTHAWLTKMGIPECKDAEGCRADARAKLLEATITANASEIERLRKDKERLDKLETLFEFHWNEGYEEGEEGELHEVTGNINDRQYQAIGKGHTLRSAIDAAFTPKTDL